MKIPESKIEEILIDKEVFFKISNVDILRPFFMSIVSASDHWMFISSNGGLTAGRKNAQFALFPYYTDDKITEAADITGSKSIFLIQNDDAYKTWEPFSERSDGHYKVTRNLYKNLYGNKVRFEEINHDLNLSFYYEWNSSDEYGFVRKSKLKNHSEEDHQIILLDGIQNILPANVGSDLQNSSSNLVDAYKRSELFEKGKIGIFALSAIIADKAEPSEALKANVVWSTGLNEPKILLSSLQLKAFRKGHKIQNEFDVKAEKGAFFVSKEIILAANVAKEWLIVAEVNQTHSKVIHLSHFLQAEKAIVNQLEKSIEAGTSNLIKLIASADGLQQTADKFRDARHYSNVLFNIMRGGIFDNNYQIEKTDFVEYLKKANQKVGVKAMEIFQNTPAEFSIFDLKEKVKDIDDLHLQRLSLEYLPLKFSRRHGDPSRPWNKFSIETQNEDGSKILNYEGNWRDIFQNWEALAHSYPAFIESMIHKFLNASTFDGYNPYRVTKDGFDWEIIEPDDPWSYIGYWGDHQIIYLLKFLEFIERSQPNKLSEYFNKEMFVYANVPYQIKTYQEILDNPKDTILYNHNLHLNILDRRTELGADGALLLNAKGEINQVNLIEKILAVTLSKFSNFIPEGGIWMNTQRPEWNDANNALVGNGVSMVTLNYLRRFLEFLIEPLKNTSLTEVQISKEVGTFFKAIHTSFEKNKDHLHANFDDYQRKGMLDELGQAGSNFREQIYSKGFSGEKEILSLQELQSFIQLGIQYTNHAIKANKRNDNLYHAYNLMTINDDNSVSISYLSEMLEGQVAILSTDALDPEETLNVLDALKSSKLFREDQYSYLLYPNKDIAKFQDRNQIPPEKLEGSFLCTEMIKNKDFRIIEKDLNGDFHFNANFKNANDLKDQLEILANENYLDLVPKEKKFYLDLYEETFKHKSFTGRSGTFFGYEGLGSIYWHMVSKLQLAAQECCLAALQKKASPEIIGRLLAHYYEINEGIGCHKSPALYGAFPTDPYSHTPAGKGAQQPGMTGQVKEDILSRFGELGVVISEGKLSFKPDLLRKEEFLKEDKIFNYFNVDVEQKVIQLQAGSLCFTYCQVPILYKIADQNKLIITNQSNEALEFDSWTINSEFSSHIFNRTNEVKQVLVQIKKSYLK